MPFVKGQLLMGENVYLDDRQLTVGASALFLMSVIMSEVIYIIILEVFLLNTLN